jgi:filamentous hemagglutinin family protein
MRLKGTASWLTLALLALPAAAFAQATRITPDVGSLGLGTTAVGRSGTVTTIDGGTLSGSNLFHSFSQFSLGAGDTAEWVRASGGAAGITNVINRVTGGQVSQISGKIDSTALPNASFFFINPAGVVFAAGAQVNVPGAAYFSTAGELRFADGARFAVATPGGSTLSIAAPESFGFLGGQGAITMDGAGASFAAPFTALSLIASDVSVTGSKIALRGLDLIGVGDGSAVVGLADPLTTAGSGAVGITGSQIAVTPAGPLSGALRIGGGDVTLDAAILVSDTAGSTRGGDVRIAADQLRLLNSPLVAASARGLGAGGDIVVTSRLIDADSGIFSTSAAADGAGGGLSITGDTLNLSNVTLGSNGSGMGAGGDITIGARDLKLDTTYVVANALGLGRGGAITITAPQMDLEGAIVFATAASTGSPGDVVIKGDQVSINSGSFGSAPGLGSSSGNLTITADTSLDVYAGFFSAVAYNDNSSGTIAFRSPRISLSQAFIDSESAGSGAVGIVDIQGGSLLLDHSRINAVSRGAFGTKVGLVQLKTTGDLEINVSQIDSSAEAKARGGTITVEGGKVTFDESELTADSNGDGRGGEVSVKADTLLISNSKVTSNSVVAGDAGDVTLDARVITMDTDAQVSSETDSLTGAAGKVIIKGGAVTLTDGAAISSEAKGGMGKAGTVTVDTDSLSLTDSTISSSTESLGDAGAVVIHTGDLRILGNRRAFTSITSDTFSDGAAGGVTIVAKTMAVQDQGYVSSNSFGRGDGGTVSIDAGSLKVLNGAYVATDSQGEGKAGDVSIRADTLTIDASGDGEYTYVSSDSLEGGDAGKVTVNAGTLSVIHGGFISSNTYAGGNAGDISITAKTMSVQDNSIVASVAYPDSAGNAGLVNITADTLTVGGNSVVSTSSAGAGDAGAVSIKAGKLAVDNSEISSAAVTGATGASGSLSINAGAVSLTNGATISTVSNNPKLAGRIDVVADSILVDGKGSAISSENQAGNVALGNPRGESGAAGAVNLKVTALTVSEGGVISTNSYAGAAGEIGIVMPPLSVLTLQGVKLPGAIQTSSGAGTGGRITISSPLAIVSNGGSILALGERRGANVAIESRYLINSSDRTNIVAVDGEFRLVAGVYDVSAGTVNRDLSVLDASKVLRGQCPVARATGQVSQLITRQVGPYVREPVSAPLRPVSELSLGLAGACS